jgi:DNA-binding response OmpR family regulator
MQVLTKPFAMDALGARVRDLMGERQMVGASAGR